ncbi:MAG: nuoC [Acidimicrobiia bacterium]|nr:nuoC [Acidimicrobiia bacterium]
MSEPSAETTAAPPEVELMHGCPVSRRLGDVVIYPTRERYIEVVKALADGGFHLIIDVCGVDYLTYGSGLSEGEHSTLGVKRWLPDGIVGERFEVVTQLMNLHQRRRIRLRVQVPVDDPQVDSLFDIYPGSEAMEREVFDMFGVSFNGHPDLTRILMPEDWIGHPLRKDYEVGRIPVQFKGANS